MGVTEELSWLAQFAGQGFEDISALANLKRWQWFALAMSRGWSDEQIDFALEWAADFDERGGVPAAAPRGASGQFVGKAAVADERAEIEALMGRQDSEYWRGPKAATLQQRYRELLAG